MHILNIKIKNHPVLKNTTFDFTDCNGNPVDTIILAGENGCGKTTVLDILSCLGELNPLPKDTLIEMNIRLNTIEQLMIKNRYGSKNIELWHDLNYLNYTINCDESKSKKIIGKFFRDKEMKKKTGNEVGLIQFNCMYLTPEITFNPARITNVTAKSTDDYDGGLIKSSADNATSITQLIIDITSQDNSDFCQLYAKNPSSNYTNEEMRPRISRFNNAFEEIFCELQIEKIENHNNEKKVLFLNRGKLVPIENLSTGEKQIVFRGGFLLQNKQSTKGALVLIDEPEISLHPDWQKKIPRFYKKIFTNGNNIQTSQIIMATHSPFVVHDEERQNEKVIILNRDSSGNIQINNENEYYVCDSKKAIEKAFNCNFETPSIPTVFFEGPTDVIYFQKAMEVFKFSTVGFQFKWIGYKNSMGQETNTGKDALNKAYQFLKTHNQKNKYILLYDSDTNKEYITENNIYIQCLPYYENTKEMNKGIENALILDSINMEPFYIKKESKKDYGQKSFYTEFKKTEFCKYICSLPKETLEDILCNLKKEIEKILDIFELEKTNLYE